MRVVAPQEKGASTHNGIDVAPRDTGYAQDLVNRQFGKPARPFDPVHPLFSDRGEYGVIVEQRRGRIVRAVMQAEDQHRVDARVIGAGIIKKSA